MDKFNSEYDKSIGDKFYFYLCFSSGNLKEREVRFLPFFKNVDVKIYYSFDWNTFDVKIHNHKTYMCLGEGENPSSCPICNTSPDKMIKGEGGKREWELTHVCPFSDSTLLEIVKDVVHIDLILNADDFKCDVENGRLQVDCLEGGTIGFSGDGEFYMLDEENNVHHFHLNEEDVYCPFCSMKENYDIRRGMFYQFCPVLSKVGKEVRKTLLDNRYNRSGKCQ